MKKEFSYRCPACGSAEIMVYATSKLFFRDGRLEDWEDKVWTEDSIAVCRECTHDCFVDELKADDESEVRQPPAGEFLGTHAPNGRKPNRICLADGAFVADE